MAKLVSEVYGEALFELAMEENKLDDYYKEVKALIEILQENPDFSRLMNHPKISKEEKLKVIDTVFEGRLSKEMTGFIRLLVNKDRYDQINSVLKLFVQKYKEERKIGVAFIKSAVTLSEKQKEDIQKRLLETTRYTTMEMHYEVEPQLIAGLTIRIGDTVVDSSVQTKLEKLKKQLMKIQLA